MNGAANDRLGLAEQWKRELPEIRRRLVEVVREGVAARGYTRVVLGLSGGLDSTVAATLCAEALGAENVFGVLMPHRATSPSVLSLAQGVANALAITSRRVNMSPVLDAYFANFPDANRLRRGLCLIWERVGVLIDLGQNYGACVVQALNRSDRVLAYGEAACELRGSLKPLCGLYKTQVFGLAELLGVLAEVRGRRPSLEHWAGQTDEGDLGHPYAVLDPLLHAFADRGETAVEAVASGVPKAAADWAEQKVRAWRSAEGRQPVELQGA